MKNNFLAQGLELKKHLIKIRRDLHQCPELGAHLPQTTAYVKVQLEEMGCQVQEIPGAGLTACIGAGRKKTLLLRADMDALPMDEKSGEPFSSPVAGQAHTCGHDLHTAFLLGAARLLKEREAELPGQVKLVFQTGEETLEGAQAMLRSGILEQPTVDAALGIHVMPTEPIGHLYFPKGVVLSSSDMFEIVIEGKGGHAAAPHLAVDPINAAAHIILGLQSLQAKSVPPDQNVVLNVCRVESGSATNIIPEQARLWGTLRTFHDPLCRQIQEQMEQVVNCTAQAFGASARLRFSEHCPCTCNDPALVEALEPCLDRFSPDLVRHSVYRLQVSDDFGFYSQKVPSAMILIGCRPSEGEACHNHSPFVRYNEDVLTTGAALLAHCAYEWLLR